MRDAFWLSDVPALLGAVALIVTATLGLRLMPHEVMFYLGMWILASFPIGILVGHCALSERQSRRRATFGPE